MFINIIRSTFATMLLVFSAHTQADLFQPYVAIETGSFPLALDIGDINGDGRNDVVLTTSRAPNTIYDPAHDYMLFAFIQKADGTLDTPFLYPLRVAYSPAAIKIYDVNNDGKKDVVVGDGGGIAIFLQNSVGSLNPYIFYPTEYSSKIQLGDLNNDGLIDLAGIDIISDYVSVMFGAADGTFANGITYYAPHGVAGDIQIGDVNNDKLNDIIVMSGQTYTPSPSVLTQKSSGGFDPVVSYMISTLPSSSLSLGVGDINGDHKTDVVVPYLGNGSQYIALFTQNTSGTLTSPPTSLASYYGPTAVAVKDLDFDSRPDVIVSHGGWSKLGVYLQQSNGILAAETLFPIPYALSVIPNGLAVGDINNDGAQDIAIAHSNNGLVILYNTTSMPSPPIANAQSLATSEDTLVNITLTGSNSTNSDLGYQVLTFPAHGLLSGIAPSLIYTPEINYNGPDSFTFKVNDGLNDSTASTVSITVEPVNDAPVVFADAVYTQKKKSVLIAVLTNDTDADGDRLSISAVSKPPNGVATISEDGQQVQYTPNGRFQGDDTFTYTASDGMGGFATASVIVTVIR